MNDEQRIGFLRNELVLWTQNKLPLTWEQVKSHIQELDHLLQQQGL